MPLSAEVCSFGSIPEKTVKYKIRNSSSTRESCGDASEELFHVVSGFGTRLDEHNIEFFGFALAFVD
jgi:hypothetical protein